MIRESLEKTYIVTNVSVFDIYKTISNVLHEFEDERLIRWLGTNMEKQNGDYYVVYHIIERHPRQPYYNVWFEYFSQGFGIIQVGYDFTRNTMFYKEIYEEIYKRLKEKDDGSEIKKYYVTRKALLNKILTTRPFELVKSKIELLLVRMKQEGWVESYYCGDVYEKDGDKLYYCTVVEKEGPSWLISVFVLREGYTIVTVAGDFYAKHDEQFLDRLLTSLVI